jgi:hypothetical protein
MTKPGTPAPLTGPLVGCRRRLRCSGVPGYPGPVHKTLGQRDPATGFPLTHDRDDADERRQANRAVAVSAVGLALTAEAAAGDVPGVIHAHARARWTGRTLRIEVEGWVEPDLPVKAADAIGRLIATAISQQLPEAGSLTWTARAAPASRPRFPKGEGVAGPLSAGGLLEAADGRTRTSDRTP